MLLAYEVDAMTNDTYWEIYTNNTHTYIATVEAEDFGDYLAQHRAEKGEDIILFPQEPYQVMTDLHIELDKWFGRDDYHLDECGSMFDPMTELDYFCEGCTAFQKWTAGKTYSDYFTMNERKANLYV